MEGRGRLGGGGHGGTARLRWSDRRGRRVGVDSVGAGGATGAEEEGAIVGERTTGGRVEGGRRGRRVGS